MTTVAVGKVAGACAAAGTAGCTTNATMPVGDPYIHVYPPTLLAKEVRWAGRMSISSLRVALVAGGGGLLAAWLAAALAVGSIAVDASVLYVAPIAWADLLEEGMEVMAAALFAVILAETLGHAATNH